MRANKEIVCGRRLIESKGKDSERSQKDKNKGSFQPDASADHMLFHRGGDRSANLFFLEEGWK